MDQILHRKLINEKNNLQLQVAKANKEVAKLMETVQQYEAVLASLDEGMIAEPINELNVMGALKTNGIGGTIKAFKANIKQRGLLGGLGIRPKQGFVKKLGVHLVKDEGDLPFYSGKTIAAGFGEREDKINPKVRAANRVIAGTAEPWLGTGYLGVQQLQKVKRGETMVKKPINPYYETESKAQAKSISEDFTVGRLNLSTLGRAALQALGGSKKQSTLGKRYTPGTVVTSPVDPYVGEVETPRVAVMGGIPKGAFKQPDGNLGQVRRLTPNEAHYDASKRSNA